jgi:uncharacterized protein (TIGR00299 family) protein
LTVLIYDPFAGLRGELNIGAMVSLGVPESYFLNIVETLDLQGVDIEFKKEHRQGIEGIRAIVKDNSLQDQHNHRNLEVINGIIEKSRIPENVKRISLGIFKKLAEAEAKVHGMDIRKVHFHETGAIDSIVDIICAAAAIDYLKPDIIISKPPELGSGFVKCQHGNLPVPPPAVAEILKDVPVSVGNVDHEATTPTGAAILVNLADSFSRRFSGRIIATGYGVGKRNPAIPNVLRVHLIETDEQDDSISSQDAMIVTCNIDDMNPELYSNVIKLLFDAGAKDVYMTPVFMKKNRPGTLLTVMVSPEKEKEINEILFLETTTAGVRSHRVKQTMLSRKEVFVETEYGRVRVKELYYNGKCISKKPEYDDLKYAADNNGISLRALYQKILL